MAFSAAGADMSYKSVYSGKWAAHKATVERVAGELQAYGRVSFGFGADSGTMLQGGSGDPNEPDIFVDIIGVHPNVSRVAVEVSGSENARVPPNDVLVRLGKYEHAVKALYPTWFYMAYPKTAVVLAVEDIGPYRNDLDKVGNDLDPYIRVPFDACSPPGRMYRWFREVSFGR